MSKPVILLTGFEPFGGDARNPSWDAVELVASRWSGPAELHVARLPVTFSESAERLGALIGLLRPDVVIATGLAAGRAAVTPEVIAINRINARIPDNAGNQPRNVPVVADGPDGLFSTLPVDAMVAAIRSAGVPASLSYSAGTFVCNAAFYALMHVVRQQPKPVRAGFIHVPATPDTVLDGHGPTMTLETIALGIEAALLACDARPVTAEPGTIA